MTKNKEWTRWFRLWGPKRPARSSDDFADYGTAFGLDMSLAAAQAEGRVMPSQVGTGQSGSVQPARFGASS